MKSLKQFINESFSAKTIKEFIKIIEDKLGECTSVWGHKNYLVSVYGILNNKPMVEYFNPINVFESNEKSRIKQEIQDISKALALGKFQEDWIHDFDGQKIIIGKDNINKLVGEDISKLDKYNGLNKWAQNNGTCLIVFHKNDTWEKIDEPLALIAIEPKFGNELINYWANVQELREKRYKNKKGNNLDFTHERDKYDHEYANKAYEIYKKNSSEKQIELLNQIIKCYMNGNISPYFIGVSRDKNPETTLKERRYLRNNLICWLFMINGGGRSTKSNAFWWDLNKQQKNEIEDFWDDLNNRFEIKDRELKVK